MSCTDNAKVSDSGYTNTCGHSQSQRSSRSSLSKNSNRSQSSGYCDGNPSTFCSSNRALPKPISKKKGKEDNKKKLETLMTLCNDTALVTKAGGQKTKTPSYTAFTTNPSDSALKQSEEVGTVELMDATDPGEHNGNRNFNTPKERLGCQANPLDTISPNSNKERLAAVVSLHDGLVLHLTASLETALGYAKDAWIGQSFIDYVHPKDKAIFTDKLASSVILPFGEREKGFNGRQTSLFCSLRKYSEGDISNKINMDTGDDSDERYMGKLIGLDGKCSVTAIYVSFHLHLSFKHYRERDSAHKTEIMFLVIAAEPVISAYKVPEETILSSIFSTRHTVTGHLSHVDDEVVQYFGYLPQDMLGRSLFSYYHPADLPYIKDIYKSVVRLEGSLFKSKPYRFAVRNGGYVVLETEWSSFINPWEKKREFVIGHHRVIRGPENPDVFQSPDIQQREFLANMTETMMKESQIIQNEICTLLAEEIPKPTSTSAYIMAKRSNDLATFMASMIHEVNGITTTSTTKAPMIVAEDRSFSEHDSVMLGEISPHHEYCDSKSSSETPPSYNQLNYDEKISRFFNSKPLLMAVYGGSEENVNLSAPSNDENINSSSNHTPSSHNLQNHDGGGCQSNENLSSGSNNQTSSTSRDGNVHVNSNSKAPYNFESPTLTEMVLHKHNQEMEKLMVQKHKERRTGIKIGKLNYETTKILNGQEQVALKEQKTQSQPRGCKRRNSHNREEKVFKIAKYDESEGNCDRNKHSAVIGNNIVNDNSLTDVPRPTINVWPQMTVTESQHQSTQNVTQCSIFPHVGNVQPTPQAPYVVAPLTGVLYPSVMDASATSSMIYVSPIILKVSTVQNQKTQKFEASQPPKPLVHIKRPASQATSIKAEPGSTTEMSESSRKLTSPGGFFSSCVSVDYGCSNRAGMQPPIDNLTRIRQIDSSLEDSSDSSFYGSFVSRSCGSRCHPEQIIETKTPETYTSRSHEAVMSEHRRFSMVNEMKANFELQTARRGAIVSQEMIQKVDVIQKPRPNHTDRNAPPWSQGVKMTPDIIYRYQMTPKTLKEVLEADRDNLKYLHQPRLVNDQLDQLYLDLELDGFGSKLILDDSNRPSDNEDISADAGTSNISPQHKPMRREMEYSKMAMVYEDNAPLP